MKKILIVEDEEVVREGLKNQLTKVGYDITCCVSIAEFETTGTQGFSLVIMDWELPDGEGIEAIKALRIQGDTTPVIMLTARVDIIDKVLGLEIGANDYMTKPFEIRELVARVKIQLKENQTPQKVLIHGELRMDHYSRKVTFQGHPLELTNMEFQLLKFFMENPGKALARDEILNEVWGFDNFPSTRTVDVHVKILREKISDAYFETLRGIGYRLKAV